MVYLLLKLSLIHPTTTTKLEKVFPAINISEFNVKLYE